jgi:glycosyltransferase involved in cell wall biosynthesis
MRVLHLISSQGPYGAENVLLNLAVASQLPGCNAVVGVLRDARNPHTEVADQARARGLEVEIFPCAGRLDPGAVAAIRRRLRALTVDVVHSHGYKANFYGYLATRRPRVPILSTCHTGTEAPERTLALRLYERLDRLVLSRLDCVVAVSSSIAAWLEASGIPSSRIETIPSGIDVAAFSTAQPTLAGLPPGATAIGMVARLVRQKGPYLLLEAAREIAARFPESVFVFVGDGPERAGLEKSAAELGLAQRTFFTGQRSDMPGVYASLGVFVLPSFSEGMPVSILEAMGAGLPVVATRVGAIPELIEPGRTGILVEPGNAAALSNAIMKLLDDPQLARRLGDAARWRAAEEHSAVAMARRYLSLYQRIRRGGTGTDD